MKRSDRGWLGSVTLVVVLALVVMGIYAFSSIPLDSSQLIEATLPATPLPGIAITTLTPSLPPSLTPLLTITPIPTETPTSTSTPTPRPPSLTPTPTHTPTPYPTALPKGMPTPLTFLPGTPTPTPVVVTQTNSTTGTMTLVAPAPMPLVDQPDNVINILLLGSDQRGIESVGLTDTIVVATIHPELPAVSLLSIPRDFYAWMPGRGFGKINTAFNRGGPELMKATILHNFGIDVDYYARIGFDSFIKVVDALGGVTVAVECPLQDSLAGTELDLQPGIHHLDGRQALTYARSRLSTSDFDRHRRQQQVLRALYHQVMNLGIIPKIPSLWGALRESVSTDLDLPGLIRLGTIGMRLDTISVKSRFVSIGAVEPWTGPEGLYILLPNIETLQSVVSEALAPLQAQEQQREKPRVEIVDGTPNEGWEQIAAQRLRWEGFKVVGVQPAEIRARTQIVDFTATQDSWTVVKLMRLYGRQGSDVMSRPSERTDIDFQILLGADYDPCTAVRSR